MRRECRERFSRRRIQRKPLVSDPGMHHGTCVTHVPWCMSGSETRGGGENVPGIPGACATRYFTYLVRGPWSILNISWSTWLLSTRMLVLISAGDGFICFNSENTKVPSRMFKFIIQYRPRFTFQFLMVGFWYHSYFWNYFILSKALEIITDILIS